MFREGERAVGDAHAVTAAGSDVGPHVEQFLGADGIPADAVEEAQQPRVLGVESRCTQRMPMIPHLGRAPDELIAAGALHAVDAQIRAADADSVLRRPGACRVVLGGHQTMPRIERNRHRCTEIHVPQAEYEVIGVEDDAVHVVDRIEAVHPSDELDVPRAPRRVGAHTEHVPLDRLAGGRVIPRQRKFDDAAGHDEILGRGQLRLTFGEPLPHRRLRPHRRIGLDLQRADTRCQVDESRRLLGGDAFGECVHAGAQREIQCHIAVFDEDVVVTAAPIGDLGGAVGGGGAPQDALVGVTAGGEHMREAGAPPQPQLRRRRRFGGTHRDEPHGVTGLELPQLPPLGRHDGHRADEAAQARAVGSEEDRGVTGEVQRPHRIRVVVDVGRMQPRFPTVGARPPGLGADQADTGAVGVEVHLVRRRHQIVDVGGGEELRRRMRSDGDAQLPRVGQRRLLFGEDAGDEPGLGTGHRQFVTVGQCTAVLAAEASHREGRPATQVILCVESAADGEIHAHPQAADDADVQYVTGGEMQRNPLRDNLSGHRHRDGCAGHGDDGRLVEAQLRAHHGDLEARRVGGIADGHGGEAEREIVHRPRRWDADLPVPDPAGPVLDRGHRSGTQDADRRHGSHYSW